LESHHHDTDEYLFFLGATFPDLVGSFDAEIEYFIGKEYEKKVITQATVLYIPAGLEHNPCDIKKSRQALILQCACIGALLQWSLPDRRLQGNSEARPKSNNCRGVQ